MKMHREKVDKPKGLVTLTLRDQHGVVVDRRFSNLIVTNFRSLQSDYAVADFSENIDQIAVGSGGHEVGDPNIPIPPTVSDTLLDVQEAIKTVTSKTQPTATEAEFSVSFSTADVSDPTSITEAGLFTDITPIMVARVTFPELVITGILTLTVTWKLIF
jgi:hypothetical protein